VIRGVAIAPNNIHPKTMEDLSSNMLDFINCWTSGNDLSPVIEKFSQITKLREENPEEYRRQLLIFQSNPEVAKAIKDLCDLA
jgi:hypothetical protein